MEEWKERLKAEYNELKQRTLKLNNILTRHTNGTLDFELNCPVELLFSQYHIMCAYLKILENRCNIEGVKL